MIRILLITLLTLSPLIAFADDFSMVKWRRVPVIRGTARVSALDSSKPLIECESVLKASEAARELLSKIIQEQQELAKKLENLKDASPSDLDRILKEIRLVTKRIDDYQEKLAGVFPLSLQEKDRVRTLTWKITPLDFADPSLFPRVPKIEWAQLEVLNGNGAWYGSFLPQLKADRPLRTRFDAFLAGMSIAPAYKKEARTAFEKLLADINFKFWRDTPGSRGIIDWEGANGIQLSQVLSPMEACVSHVALNSSILLDYEVNDPAFYPNPTTPTLDDTLRLGMGSVILSYFNPAFF